MRNTSEIIGFSHAVELLLSFEIFFMELCLFLENLSVPFQSTFGMKKRRRGCDLELDLACIVLDATRFAILSLLQSPFSSILPLFLFLPLLLRLVNSWREVWHHPLDLEIQLDLEELVLVLELAPN